MQARRSQLLGEASALLWSSLVLDETLGMIARLSVGAIADWCAIDLLEEDGTLRRVAVMHQDPAKVEWAREFQRVFQERMAGKERLSPVFATGEAVLMPEITDDLLTASVDDPEMLEILRAMRLKSAITAPLTARGRVLGIITFVTENDGRVFDNDDLELATELGRRAGLAIDNAQLHEQSLRREKRLQFLADSTELLSASLDFEETLRRVVRLMVPALADVALVYLRTPHGDIERMAVASIEPAVEESFRSLPTTRIEDDDELARAVRSGEAKLLATVTEEMLAQFAKDEAHLAFLRSLGVRSTIVAPLVARGRSLGVLGVSMTTSERRYDREDFRAVRDLARHCGLAIDNARLHQEAERANETKDQFMAILAHEVRQPLTTLTSGLTLMRSRPNLRAGAEGEELLRDMADGAAQIRQILDDLMGLSRADLRAGVTTEPVLLQRELSRLVREHRRPGPKRTVNLEVPDELPPVQADTQLLRHIVSNLLSNADKYSAKDRPIDVHAAVDADSAVVVIRDHGPGLPAEDLERVFEPFYRSPHTRQSARGTGIGLTVCRRLIEVLGGRIWAAPPASGDGLEMRFTLPLAGEDAAPGDS